MIGALLFVAGQVWYITQTGDTPAYVTEYLPGIAISGAGVGLMIPTLTGAGTSSLAPARFATGAAVLTMGRQIGAALGVALIGSPSRNPVTTPVTAANPAAEAQRDRW